MSSFVIRNEGQIQKRLCQLFSDVCQHFASFRLFFSYIFFNTHCSDWKCFLFGSPDKRIQHLTRTALTVCTPRWEWYTKLHEPNFIKKIFNNGKSDVNVDWMLPLALASFIASILHCYYNNNNNELHRDVHIECTNWQTTSTFESKRNEKKNPNNSWIQHLTHDEIKINIKMCTMDAATGWATATKSDKKKMSFNIVCVIIMKFAFDKIGERKLESALCHCHTNNRVFFASSTLDSFCLERHKRWRCNQYFQVDFFFASSYVYISPILLCHSYSAARVQLKCE